MPDGSPGAGPDARSPEGPAAPPVLESARHDQLVRRGWRRRFAAPPPRLDEVMELYESLGLEVRAERAAAGDVDGPCGGCSLARHAFRVVYTRERST